MEVRRAAQAFNEMQERVRRLIENRTLMLAAISHDLRTQLTLLRLKTEALPAAEERDRLMQSIADMEAMLAATLAFARDEAASEAPKHVDVAALVGSIVDDMADAGLAVAAGTIEERVAIDCKPLGLRRAITNLAENAVKYGRRATLSLRTTADTIQIFVDDEGPGIPEAELGRVLQPFYRLEESRNLDTGGVGLGLAIANSVARAHGGALQLAICRGAGSGRRSNCRDDRNAPSEPTAAWLAVAVRVVVE